MANIGIIPARYASSRFPGKPLALIHGKPMIQWVFERSKLASLQKVVVATDDERIYNAVLNFGGEAAMTSSNHQSGTERCAEVADLLNLTDNDVIVNIQGDEPFIQKEAIDLLTSTFDNSNVQIATLAKPFAAEDNPQNPNMVKVVCSRSGRAIYFSRSPIPFYRNTEIVQHYYKHIGIYAYRYNVLKQLTQLKPSPLENAEKLEQLRWIENDYHIQIAVGNYESVSIDTPEDLIKAESLSIY